MGCICVCGLSGMGNSKLCVCVGYLGWVNSKLCVSGLIVSYVWGYLGGDSPSQYSMNLLEPSLFISRAATAAPLSMGLFEKGRLLSDRLYN